jgi:hypothetical protein
MDEAIGAARRAVPEVPALLRWGTAVTGDSDHCPSGVYVIDAAERERVLHHGVFPPDFAVAVLDGAGPPLKPGSSRS